ncbi:hypothetical protein J6590_099692 [Homalodisca vitripennis]|nr:hypothetical protein J6590_099692 [Homalodisca vitripennis]
MISQYTVLAVQSPDHRFITIICKRTRTALKRQKDGLLAVIQDQVNPRGHVTGYHWAQSSSPESADLHTISPCPRL